MLVKHTIPPVYDENSQVLTLGTIPSPKSREYGFFYGHPRNRFWRLIEAVTGDIAGDTPDSRSMFLKRNKIALWDVLSQCEIEGAADSTIKNARPNNIKRITSSAPIKAVFTTGEQAYKLYNKFCRDVTGFDAIKLPSPSPANCAMSFERLLDEYRIISDYL